MYFIRSPKMFFIIPSYYDEAVQLAISCSVQEGSANIERDNGKGDGEHTVARFVQGRQVFGWSVEHHEMIYHLPHRGVDCPHGCPDHSVYG